MAIPVVGIVLWSLLAIVFQVGALVAYGPSEPSRMIISWSFSGLFGGSIALGSVWTVRYARWAMASYRVNGNDVALRAWSLTEWIALPVGIAIGVIWSKSAQPWS